MWSRVDKGINVTKYFGTTITQHLQGRLKSWQANLRLWGWFLEAGKGVWWKEVPGGYHFFNGDMTPTFIRKVQSSVTLGPPHWKRCESHKVHWGIYRSWLTSTALWKWQSIQHSTATLNSHAEPQTTEVPDEAEILLNTEGYASDSDLPNDPVDSETTADHIPTRLDQVVPIKHSFPCNPL